MAGNILTVNELAALQEIAQVENALLDGHPATTIIGSHQRKSALRVAAERMGVNTQSLRSRIGTSEIPGSIWTNYHFTVDWTVYKPPAFVPTPISKVEPAPVDEIEQQKNKDELTQLRNDKKELQRRLIAAEEWRSSILGLSSDPIKPSLNIPPRPPSQKGGRTVILHLSDIHYGETISFDEMDGVNKYDSEIAKVRLGRFFGMAASLMTKYWQGRAPDEIILCLGGDLISGMIHAELLETNVPSVPYAVREVGELIAGGIEVLRREVQCPIRVYSVPGNHGRMTIKPQSKGRAVSSLDMLATDFCEAGCRGIKGVTFYRSTSPDAYFSTYGWNWLTNHGDSAGGKGGGTGFIGPLAVIMKMHRKLMDTSWRSGRAVHYVLTGHYHTTAKTTFGWSNGSVCGYGEYARDLRADPEPARQNYLVVHPEHGVIEERPIYLGHPDEGSLYKGPAGIARSI